ncbi:MAG: efflux RND transporter permease subunit [Firmicutes bacterium]|nr:efflux RND transporter permease subunit [Bacillota bacterium]
MTVVVDGERLEEFGLTLESVTNALRIANINVPGGNVTEDDTRWQIRTLVSTQTVDALKELMIGATVREIPGQPEPVPVPVRLADVAEISLQAQPTETITRLNAQPNISISLNKRSDANTVVTANQIRAELDTLSEEFTGLTFTPVDGQSQFIQLSIDSIITNALFGGLLALLILLLFLRSVRNTLIIAISIPVSVVSTFILMYFAGLTVNMMTLSGIALGVGMLVDNAIVVIENIYRHLEQGDGPKEAAINGAKEVAMAITASTLTTVAVFLPVVFVGGIAGILFEELALTVSFALLASLAVALTVIPMLSAVFAKRLKPIKTSRLNILPFYRRALAWALSKRVLVLVVTALLFVGSLALVPRLGGEFIPAFDEGTGSINVTLPADATLEETEAAVAKVEAVLLADADVELISTTIGGGGGGGMGAMFGRSGSSGQANQARISFQLAPIEERGISTARFMEELEPKLPEIPDVEIGIRQQRSAAGGGMFGGSSVEVEITGTDLEQLAAYAEELQNRISDLEYVNETSSSISQENPEVHVQVDLERAMLMGINPMQVGSAIRSAFQSTTATNISSSGYDLSVIVGLQAEQRDSIEDVARVVVSNQSGRVVRVEDVAEVETAHGPRAINRRDNQRYVTVTANLTDTDMFRAQRDIQMIMDEFNLASGYNMSFQGQIMEMEEAFSGLLLALALAIALVYMVMASQFESLIHPFTVMFTLPLAAIGVIGVLLVTGSNLSIIATIGIVVLAGIVVNNAIVLVDYVNQLRARDLSVDEALLEAGQTRLRPILMTTLTTILAMIPLAVRSGSGMEMQQPLALTVIGGLAVGALLTLFIIPLIYKTFERLLPKATNIVQE